MKCWLLMLGSWKAPGEQREWSVFLCMENDMDKWTPIWVEMDLFPKYLRHILFPFHLSSSALQIFTTHWLLFFHEMSRNAFKFWLLMSSSEQSITQIIQWLCVKLDQP